MRSRVPLFALLLIAGSLALPLVAYAGVPFFGPIIPNEQITVNGVVTTNQNVCAAGWGMLITVINNIISLLITLAIVFVAPLMIAWSGFLFVVNPVNAAGKEQAKKILTNTIVGIVLALAGYLIVAAIMAVLYDPGATSGKTTLGAWADIVYGNSNNLCIPLAASLKQAAPGVNVMGVTASGGSSSGGSCAAPAAGPCSIAEISKSCFASRAQQASQICNLESAGGKVDIPSGSDKLNGGSGPSYSIGLWQLNLTTTPGLSVNGVACTSAFTVRCGGSNLVGPSKLGACNSSIKPGDCGSISCQDLYTQCVALAKDPVKNTAAACALYGSSSSFQPWTTSANKCGVPLKGS